MLLEPARAPPTISAASSISQSTSTSHRAPDAVISRAMPRRRRVVLLVAASAFLAVLLVASVAPANVQEQRARLPPPAENCQDPVEGVWMSHAYYPYMAQWYIFTLTIRRTAGSPTALEGQVHSHYWTGNDRDEQPPPCNPGMLHRTVIMPA